MIWLEYIRHLAPPAKDGGSRLRPAGPPADDRVLGEVEAELGVALPHDLRGLLAEMDGVRDRPRHLRLIMSAEAIAQTNRSMRELTDFRMAFDRLLIFAQAGNGDVYGFPVEGNQAQDNAVVEWDHELDESTRVASSLRDFLRWWVTTRAWT